DPPDRVAGIHAGEPPGRHLEVPMLRYSRLAALVVLGLATVGPSGHSAFAQQDTVPPVLLSVTFSPIVFDTGTGSVNLRYCIEAEDDLSGVQSVFLTVLHPPGPLAGLRSNGEAAISRGALHVTGCGTYPIAQYSTYGVYKLWITVVDGAGNS